MLAICIVHITSFRVLQAEFEYAVADLDTRCTPHRILIYSPMSPALLKTPPPPTCARQSSMAAYLWLVWYQGSSRLTPKHWALAVTY